MSASKVHWSAGERSVQARVERALATNLGAAPLLHASRHRSVHRVDASSEPDGAEDTTSLVVKIHLGTTGPHPLRERLKRRFGRSAARREWIALGALHEAGVSVPRPRAWGTLANGNEIVVVDYLVGEPAGRRIQEASPRTRAEILDAMARTIEKLHGAGYRHGDLHLGNLWSTDSEIALLDVQSARMQRTSQDRLLDVAQLELSLARAGCTPAERGALRDRLGVGDAYDLILRRFLRDHLRGRARRVLRVGRNWATARVGRLRGLRDASLENAALASLVEACEDETGKPDRRDGRVRVVETELGTRPLFVKRSAAGNLRRAVSDRLRGSPAARAFRAGQAIGLLADRAARPLAFLEERRLGFPVQSWLVLERVGDEDLDRIRPGSREDQERLARALGEWLADVHAWGLSHRDLKAGNLRVAIRADAIRFWMIDLEDLSGPSERTEEERLHALAQLNASLAEDAFSIEARLAALDSYRARLPFSLDQRDAGREIARRSLARAHRWRGNGCDLGGALGHSNSAGGSGLNPD